MSRSQTKDERLEGALGTLSTYEEAFEQACTEYADAESDYRVKFAQRFLEAEGTEKARHSTAIVAVADQLRRRDKAEAVKEFTKEKLRDAQTTVSAYQSLLYADVRTNTAVS